MSGTHYYGYDRPADQTDDWPFTPTVHNWIKMEIKNLPFLTSFLLEATFARAPALY